MAPKVLFLGFQACPRTRERGCRGVSADLVPTSRPLRSEQALGSVVPSPYPPQTCRHINTRGLLNQGELMSKTWFLRDCNQAAALCRVSRLLFFLARASWSPRQGLSGAAPDGTSSRAGRTRRGTYRMFPRVTRTTQPRSPNTCLLAVLRQVRPTASAEFLTSTTSQWLILSSCLSAFLRALDFCDLFA